MWRFLFVVFVAGRLYGQTLLLDVYLVQQCREAGVSVDIAAAILEVENPALDPLALHVNANGTVDKGLFQLNSGFLYSDFVPRYWVFDMEFRWDNPYHSTYVAVRLLRDLYRKYGNWYQACLAYNCGSGRVDRGTVPGESLEYAARVFKISGLRARN
jgi:hypothetical protein